MKQKKIAAAVVSLLCISSLLAGCGVKESTETTDTKTTETEESAKVSDHEPITIVSAYKNMGEFIDMVHAQYPEVNLEIISYTGNNYSAYVGAQLESGDMPDIYSTKVYSPEQLDMGDRLIDLAGYDFLSKYSEARLSDVSDNGKIYMIPTYYDCLGITYNKTLLEKNGWTLPKSFKELEELAPKVEEAGYQLAVNQIQYLGYGFQYLCNILDTDFLNTLNGRVWQNDFLAGDANVENTQAMLDSMKVLDKWRDLGMLNGNGDPEDDEKTRKIMAEGNTLFMLGNARTFDADETTDEFGLMPYLSEDGSQNAYIKRISVYWIEQTSGRSGK